MPPAVVTPVQFQNQKKMLTPQFTDMKLYQIQIEDTWHLSENRARSLYHWNWDLGCLGVVSLMFHKLFKIFSPKIVYCRYCISYENFKFKLCTCAQSYALGTCIKFQLETLIINVFSGIVYFHMIMFESSWNVSETTPGSLVCSTNGRLLKK